MSLTYPKFDSGFRLLCRADLDAILGSVPDVSDFYFCNEEPVRATVKNKTVQVTSRPLDAGDIKNLVTILGDEALGLYQNLLTRAQPKDRSYVSQQARVRHRVSLTLNSAKSNQSVRIVMRRLESEPWKLEKLRLPPGFLEAVAKQEPGLVLVVGATGSGKTSLLSGGLRYVVSDENRHGHLVTIEDPVEYNYDKVANVNYIVSQMEVGVGCEDFAIGLRAAMRMHPTDILVGEIRDPETAAAAIAAARSGHKVFATMHVSSAAEVFGRWSDFFPPGSEQRALNDLASVIDYIVYQTLEDTEMGFMPIQESLDLTKVNRTEFTTMISSNIDNLYKVMDQYVKEHGITHLSDRLACNPVMAAELEAASKTFAQKGSESKDSIQISEIIPIPLLASQNNHELVSESEVGSEVDDSDVFDVTAVDDQVTEEVIEEQYRQDLALTGQSSRSWQSNV